MLTNFRAIMFVILICVSSIAQADSSRTVTTSGDSVLYVVPDKAVVTLAINTTEVSLADAEKINETKGQTLVDALMKLGIDPKQIATSAVSISMVYRDNTGRRQADVDGYATVREYTVTVTDIKLVQKVIDTAVANGVNTLTGVQYEDTQARKHRDEARKMAAKAAKEKAAELVSVFDSQVGRPLSIDENTVAASALFGNNYSNSMSSAAAEGTGEDSVPPGQLAVRASVTVKFEVLDGVAGK